MTWYPLQAAIKMSTLPGAIRATLDVLLDHINAWKDPTTGTVDPTRPQTLMVFESLGRLAVETGFSTVTVADHLKRLRGEKELRKGLKVKVLLHDPDTDGAKHHRAARYHLNPAVLDDLVDHERLKAFERRLPDPDHLHPYQLWRDWRTATSPPQPSAPTEASQGISSLYPEAGTDNGQGISSLDADGGQGISCLTGRVQAAYTEFTNGVDPEHQLTSFLSDPQPAPTTPEKKERVQARPQAKTKTRTPAPVETPPPPDIPITPELKAWWETHAPGRDLRHAITKFLLYARAKGKRNADWTAAFCFYVLNGQERQVAANQQRERSPVLEAIRAQWRAEEDARQAAAADPEWTSVQGIYGRHQRCGTYHQRHGLCPAAVTDTGPPAESSTLHQRYVVQTAGAQEFVGLGEALAVAARNGNGHGHHHGVENPP